jgi:vacuolar-type H+-ATPase subunit E/Vma4
MAKMDERVEMIGSSILAQAQHESKELIAKANNERDEEITKYEEQIIQEMFQKVQKQTAALRISTVKAVSSARTLAHQSVLKRREELADVVVASVRSKLIDYVRTPEYAASLKAEIASLSGRYNASASTFYLRGADMDMAAEIEALLPGCAVKADPAIKAGGWKMLNTDAGIMIDETIDARLAAQKPWFLMNSGLRLM